VAPGEPQVQVALAGLPGVGKTELARQVVARLQLAATYLREYYGDDHPSVITTRAKLAALLQR
jgi:broad-specificity NMP kinase